MSRRLGTNINSELFMTNPVPINTSNHYSNISKDELTYIIKGDNDKEPSNTSHNLENQEVFIINSETGSFQLHRKTLRETLHELKKHCHVSIRQLSAEHTESFKSIVETLRILYGSQALYDIVLKDIRTIFVDVKDVKPGTVGAFFIGCFNDDKFPGPMGCSPKCAASLPPTDGTPGYAACDDLVLIYSNGVYSSLNEKQSAHAYIYIDDTNFTSFTSDNIRQLKEAGVTNVSLIYGKNDGSYSEVTSSISIDKLPCRNEHNNNNQTVEPTTAVMSGATGLVFGILIAIVIFLIILLLYRRYNQ